MEYDSDLIHSYIIIPPFAGTAPGDTILIYDYEDMLILFNKEVLSLDFDKLIAEKIINNTRAEDRKFARNIGGHIIKYEPVVDEKYRIKLPKDIVEKHNLYDGVTMIEEGHHLICKPGKIKKR